jgi:hypothetical protein
MFVRIVVNGDPREVLKKILGRILPRFDETKLSSKKLFLEKKQRIILYFA